MLLPFVGLLRTLIALMIGVPSAWTPVTSGVTITPDLASRSVPAHSGNWTAIFWVQNTQGSSKTFNLSCSGVATCSVTPSSVTLGAGAQVDVDVAFTTGNQAPHGNLTVSATGGGTGSGTMSLNIGPAMVRMTGPGPDGSATQTVHRSRPVLRADFVLPSGEATDTNSIRIWWRGKTDSTVALRRNAAMLEWLVPADLALAPGDTGTFKVHLCLQSGVCTDESRVIQLPADQTPVLDFGGMPFESGGGGFTAGFGPGLAVSGPELTAGIATPAYVSMGAARSAALVYSTATSYPRALIATDILVPWPTTGSYDLIVKLYEGGVKRDSVAIASATCGVGTTKRCRVVLQANQDSASYISGGVVRRTYLVEVRVTNGGTTKVTTDSIETVLVDRRSSPYGSGWWASAGTQLVQAGSDRILVGPTGSSVTYRGSGDSLYLPPPGSTTNLFRAGTGWELRTRGTPAKIVFDANGRMVKALDASGNRDSVAYDGSGRVTDLIDPTARRISFYYGSGTQKLDSIVSLPGSGSQRRTRISIDTATNQLRYDSLPSPGAHPVVANYEYETYTGAKGTALLRSRYGRYGSDRAKVTYDSAAGIRPYRVTLRAPLSSASDNVAPVMTYRAAELRGYHTVTSADSVNVEVTDPLGNWTRALTARAARTGLSWDSVGVLSRDSLDGHGRLVWAEGKVADSGRAYTRYDSLGRAHRVFTLRSANDTLWLSRVYFDANDRVYKRLDPQGHADSTAYDVYGRPTYARDVAGAVTRFWYRTDGLLDSVQVPNAVLKRRFLYTSSWLNLQRTYVTGDSLSNDAQFDGQGVANGALGRIRVRISGSQSVWRWRLSTTWRDAAGRTDSSTVYETADCTGSCGTPGTFTRKRSQYVLYDSVGQVRQIRDSGTAVSYRTFIRDRLGRVLETQRNGAPGDSLLYDLAGNVDTTVTRRGYTLTSTFDRRGRVTATVVPGYGTIQRTYGGPADQLTSLTVSGHVDSIGGARPDRKWVYDQRGRLLSDTLWTGSRARATTYAYDAYDRPDQTVDARGTTSLAYDATVGRLTSVLTPFGDSLLYTWDSPGRPTQARVRHPIGRTVTQAWSFTSAGAPETYGTTLPSGGGNPGYDAGTWSDFGDFADANAGITLLPEWSRQDGDTGTLHIERDSLRYDGLERLTLWKGMTDGTLSVLDSFRFDGSGNLRISADSVVFETGTNRLLERISGGRKYNYGYDAAGNLTVMTDSTVGSGLNCRWMYDYDALDRLDQVRIKPKVGDTVVVARYAYDVLGDRIARRVYTTVSGCSSATPRYVRYGVQGGHVLFESDSSHIGLDRQYTWGLGTDDLVAFKASGVTSPYYAVKDQLGTIRAWVDSSGAWQWGGRYHPYGVQAESRGASPDQPYGWTGREYDPETGFYFLRARYYDPRIGRFTQEDPIGEAGGNNLYAYVEGQPLEARDPSGLLRDHALDDPCPWECMRGGWDGWYGFMDSRSLLPFGPSKDFRKAWAEMYEDYKMANCFLNTTLQARGFTNEQIADILAHATMLSYRQWNDLGASIPGMRDWNREGSEGNRMRNTLTKIARDGGVVYNDEFVQRHKGENPVGYASTLTAGDGWGAIAFGRPFFRLSNTAMTHYLAHEGYHALGYGLYDSHHPEVDVRACGLSAYPSTDCAYNWR